MEDMGRIGTSSIASTAAVVPSAAASAAQGGPRLGRSGGGTAAAAILNTEDVVIGPGEAGRASTVSSPNLEKADPADDQKYGDGADALDLNTSQPPAPAASATTDDFADPTGSSRTSTPTPGSFGSARVMTPTQAGSSTMSAIQPLGTVSQQGTPGNTHDERRASADRRASLQLFTGGGESGANTPALPIGLTSAPSSALTPAIPTYGGEGHPQIGAKPLTKETNNLRITLPSTPMADARHTRNDSSSTMRGPSLTPTNHRMPAPNVPLLPIVVRWRGGGKEVFVTGTFANEWRSKILLRKNPQASAGKRAEYSCVLHLAPGTHRLKFIVDDRWRVSRDLSTASDGEGNLTNYIEVAHQGPAHPGPLSAPGEDLLDGEQQRQKELQRQQHEQHQEQQRKQEQKSGTAELGHGHRATNDLIEEARRAEALQRGDLLDVFGEDKVRAEECWTQEIPASIIHAQEAEERVRDELERAAAEEEDARRRGGTKNRQRSQSASGSARRRHVDDDDDDGENAIPAPPTLPRQLEKAILNSAPAAAAGSVDDKSVLPAPNHAVLHHLTASAIKSGVIATGCTVRYRKKYITTVYFRAAS